MLSRQHVAWQIIGRGTDIHKTKETVYPIEALDPKMMEAGYAVGKGRIAC